MPDWKEEHLATKKDSSISYTEEAFRARWQAFLNELEHSGKSVLQSHFELCDIASFHNGLLRLDCKKKFSYDFLLDNTPEATQALVQFFATPIRLLVRFDKAAAETLASAEVSERELFYRLAEDHPAIKLLIDTFGAEPMY